MAEESQLPSERDLQKLPRWARVAYAARSARRAQPLFTLAWPSVPEMHVEAIERTIALVEISTREGRANDVLSRAGSGIVDFFDQDAFALNRLGRIKFAVSNAADAALFGAINKGHFAEERKGRYAADAARFSVRALEAIQPRLPLSDVPMIAAAVRDFELLLQLSREDGWTDDSPVDLDLLGPLWPDGEPEWWPEEPLLLGETPPVLSLEFALPVQMDEDQAAEAISSFIEGCSELHYAMGGTGLRFHTPPVSFEPALDLVPAGGGGDDDGGRIGGGQ
jgi:hypothetical protein